MAVWQFAVDLLPSSTTTVDGIAAARMSRAELDVIKPNFARETQEVLLKRLGAILSEKPSWGARLRIWGDEKIHDVQVVMNEGAIDEVQIRLHVGELSVSLVAEICRLARDLECVLATRDGAIIRPYGEALVRAIGQSDAART